MMRFTILQNLMAVIILVLTVGAQAQSVTVIPISEGREILHDYLMAELDTALQERQAAYTAALASPAALESYQAQMQADYRKILGDFPEKNDLNANTVSTLNKDGYNVELVEYESRPNHHVVANLYTPSSGGPYPGIVIPCGHYPVKSIKSIDYSYDGELASYQRLGISLAKNGYVALIIDPVASGERAQILKSDADELSFQNESGTKPHSMLASGSHLVGTSVVAYEVWDNVRGIDYLYTRSDVDTTKIGVAGSSGGGAQTMFLLGYDRRIDAACIVSGLTTVESMWSNGGPQDGCQNLAHQGMFHINQQDYLSMNAPVPITILQGAKDGLFLSAGAEAGYNDAKRAYDALSESDKIGYLDADESHGFLIDKREAAVRWFNTHFKGDNSAVSEPDYSADVVNPDDLMVTSTGQTYTHYTGEMTIPKMNVALADSYQSDRDALWADEAAGLVKVKELIALNADIKPASVEKVETIERDTYNVEKWKITSGENPVMPAHYYLSKTASGKMPAVLWVNGLGKNSDVKEGGFIERFFVDSGYVALAVDLRGFGETADNSGKNETKHQNKEHRNSVISEYVGKSLIGMRVEDVMVALDALTSQENVDASNVTIVGLDRAATAVLHAAALHEDKFASVKIYDFDYDSYRELIADPHIRDQMTHVVIGAMKHYDLTNLSDVVGDKLEKGEKPAIPEKPALSIGEVENKFDFRIFPNPSKDATTLTYELSKNSKVQLELFSIEGRKLASLVNAKQSKGVQHYKLDTRTLVTGIYLTKLTVNGGSPATVRLVVE